MMHSFIPSLLFTGTTIAQYVSDWGCSGGTGPSGGLGDIANPVLTARAIITDGYIPITPNTTRQLAEADPPSLTRQNASCTTPRRSIIIDSTARGAQQEILGFGHAWTDATVDVFDELEPAVLEELFSELFGQDGNNMGLMRHTIGASDLSGMPYTYDDNGPSAHNGRPDPKLSTFALGDAGTRMAQMIAKTGAYKQDVFLYGAPWSYPGWMKKNGLFVAPNLGGNHFLFNNSLSPAYLSQAAQYLVDYVDAYNKLGVKINGLSLMNEPLNYQGGYPTMFLDAADASTLLRQGLSRAMRRRNVKIFAYDHNTDQPAYPARVMQDAPTAVDAIAWHCYQPPVADYTILEDFRDQFPLIPQFMTECANTAMHPGTTNFWIAQNFIPSVRHGASGGSFWTLATNSDYGPRSTTGGCQTCSGSIFVNSSTTYTKTIDYYMMGQFSRFIRKGAVNYRILEGLSGGPTDWDSQFWAIAVRNPDHGWAVVFLNSSPSTEHVKLEFTASGLAWTGDIPGQSVVTWLLPADARLQNSTAAATAQSC